MRATAAVAIHLSRNDVAPTMEGVEEVVITKQVVEGTAPPLHIYPDSTDRTSDAIA